MPNLELIPVEISYLLCWKMAVKVMGLAIGRQPSRYFIDKAITLAAINSKYGS